MNAYKVLGPAVINFSGGRSSAFMLKQILDAHGGRLPDDVVPVFCNTGKELNETLDFVHECGVRWGVKVVWLEFRYKTDAAGGRTDPKNTFEVVSHNSADRTGRPFDELITSRGLIPGVRQRICTTELKVRTVQRYLNRTYGWMRKHYTSILGIRLDERRRWSRILSASHDRCRERLPMVDARHDRGDVSRFWEAQPFDLGIPSAQGNCDLCFLKGKRNLVETIRARPELADWWIARENQNLRTKTKFKNPRMAQFKSDTSYMELRDLAMLPADPTLWDYADEQEPLDCFCTD